MHTQKLLEQRLFPSLHNCKCFIHSVCMSVAFYFVLVLTLSNDPKVYFLFVANILYEYLVFFHSLCFRCLSSLITFFLIARAFPVQMKTISSTLHAFHYFSFLFAREWGLYLHFNYTKFEIKSRIFHHHFVWIHFGGFYFSSYFCNRIRLAADTFRKDRWCGRLVHISTFCGCLFWLSCWICLWNNNCAYRKQADCIVALAHPQHFQLNTCIAQCTI